MEEPGNGRIRSSKSWGRWPSFPKPKAATFEDANKLLEAPGFEPHDIYRALEVLAKENNRIQSGLYQNSKKLLKRNERILYYDCTIFFFEMEKEKGLKQYGLSKEHRPNPIVQLGLFMASQANRVLTRPTVWRNL